MSQYSYAITYLGHVLDVFDTRVEATAEREALVDRIMNDEVPDFLGRDDFDSRGDCRLSLRITKGEYE